MARPTPEVSAVCAACSAELAENARVCAVCGTPVASAGEGADGASGPSSVSRVSRRGSGVPERRQATVLFCDLVDSTTLSGQLDPEDLREVILEFRRVADSVLARHEAFHGGYAGDGVLGVFAYPVAHEDDPQRAVRAGLELLAEIHAINRPGVHLRARVGIATGVVVIGPAGSGATPDEVAVGQTTNLAARLQSFAAPDTLMISDVTKRLVESHFDCTSLGAHSMKGFDKPVSIWQVVRERTEQDAVAPKAETAGTIPLVGRDRELGILRARWQEARAGAGQLVVIQGEPGVGKSRLVLELVQHIANEPHVVLRYLCAPRFRNSALFPVIRQVERAAGFSPDDTTEQKLDKIEAFVAKSVPNEGEPGLARVLAALMSVPFGTRYPPLVESPERLKQRTFHALKEAVYAAARGAPVLLVMEDVHWADPTTIELLNDVLSDVRQRPILVVATVRPGFGAAWPTAAKTSHLDVPRLDSRQAQDMLEHVARGRKLHQNTIAQILEKSEGVPLFLEELAKTVLDSGVFDARRDTGPTSRELATIPSTLQDSLAARLDRLSEVKDVAQVAAAIGREFSLDLLSEVLAMPEPKLKKALETLAAADVVRLPSDTLEVCSFKHVLLQDAAYAMMVRGTRRSLHQRIGKALEQRRAANRAVDADVLAHHWIESGEHTRAIPYLEEAAQLASRRAAHTEATGHWTRALELVALWSPAPLRDEHEARLLVGLGLATSATQGYASPEVESAYQRSLTLCRSLGHHTALFPALRGLSTFYIVRASLATARDLGEECLRFAEQSGNPADLIESATALGYTLVYQGALADGRTHLERAVELYRQHDGEKLSYPSLQDPAVACLSLDAVVAFIMGDVRTSERLHESALELADRIGLPFNRAYAQSFAALYGNVRQRFQEAAEHAGQAIRIADEHGFPVWLGAATMHQAIARGSSVDAAAAIPVLTHMLGLWQAGGAELNRPFFLLGLARCQWQAGQPDVALRTLDEAFGQSSRSGELFILPEIHRLRGEVLRSSGPDDKARWRAEFENAASTARTQGAHLLELRALSALLTYGPEATAQSAIRERLTELMTRSRAANEDHTELRAAESALTGA